MGTTLRAQLRAARDANVAEMELFEDGSLKAVKFFPTASQTQPPDAPSVTAPAQAPMNLMTEVIMAEGNPVHLDTADFPDGTFESDEPAEDEAE